LNSYQFGDTFLKLYIFKKWHPGVQNIELEEWDTDEGIFKKEIAKAKNGGSF